MTVFNPVQMGALLVLKLFIPFFLVSAAFGVIQQMLGLPKYR